MKKIGIALLAFSAVSMGCGQSGQSLNIHFDNTLGLGIEDRVFYEDIPIGEVADISRIGAGDYAVLVNIQHDFNHLVTEYARFYIIGDPLAEGKKAVELVRQRKGGARLAEGAHVDGFISLSDRYQRAVDGFQSGLDELKDQLESFSDEIARIPESEEYLQFKRKLEDWSEEMMRSGQKARDTFEKEILPKLREELKALKEKLRKRKKEEVPEQVQV